MSESRSVDPDRSVTCAICGELADERRTVAIDTEQQYLGAPESFERIGKLYMLEQLGYEGEAHQSCVTNCTEVTDE